MKQGSIPMIGTAQENVFDVPRVVKMLLSFVLVIKLIFLPLLKEMRYEKRQLMNSLRLVQSLKYVQLSSYSKNMLIILGNVSKAKEHKFPVYPGLLGTVKNLF